MLLEIALLGLGGALLLGVWDVARRQLALSDTRPAPEDVESFEIEKLAELTARVHTLELNQGAIADQALHELELSRAERKKATATASGEKGGRAARKKAGELEPNWDELTPEQRDTIERDEVRARYEPKQ